MNDRIQSVHCSIPGSLRFVNARPFLIISKSYNKLFIEKNTSEYWDKNIVSNISRRIEI